MSERKGKAEEYLIMDDIIDGLDEIDFSKYMNPPEPNTGQAYVKFDFKTGKNYVCCPWCGKKAFPVSEGAEIRNQEFKCRGSNCKKAFWVNIGGHVYV